MLGIFSLFLCCYGVEMSATFLMDDIEIQMGLTYKLVYINSHGIRIIRDNHSR